MPPKGCRAGNRTPQLDGCVGPCRHFVKDGSGEPDGEQWEDAMRTSLLMALVTLVWVAGCAIPPPSAALEAAGAKPDARFQVTTTSMSPGMRLSWADGRLGDNYITSTIKWSQRRRYSMSRHDADVQLHHMLDAAREGAQMAQGKARA